MATYYSDMVNRRTCVYRFYNEADELLYVGMSMNLNNRLNQHRRRDWWRSVVRCDVQWFEGREAAKSAERAAIARENPIHNVARPANLGVVFRDITPGGAAL